MHVMLLPRYKETNHDVSGTDAELQSQDHKTARFAETPWNEQSDEWQRLDARLPEDHLARRIDEACTMLDLSTLRESYAGVGKKGPPPEILVRIMLYEIQSRHPSPAHWARNVRENEPLRWLARGSQPSRSTLYAFRDRVEPWVDQWNESLVAAAVEQGMTPARRAAIDRSTFAANASPRKLANQERLDRRQQLLDDAIQGNLAEDEQPRWMASTPSGQLRQQETYDRANEILQQRKAYNDQQRSSKRKPPDKVLVSMTDPDAALGRDKLGTFRPLSNVQLLRDLDSPRILAYDTFAATNDAGLIGPLLDRAAHAIGQKLKQALARIHIRFGARSGGLPLGWRGTVRPLARERLQPTEQEEKGKQPVHATPQERVYLGRRRATVSLSGRA